MSSKPSTRALIFIATPCYGGMVTQEYMLSILALVGHACASNFDALVALQGHDSLITRSRNTLVAHFLKATPATHLMFIDADIGFDPVQVERMIAFDEEVVAGIYPLKVRQWGASCDERDANGERLDTATLLYVGMVCGKREIERRGAFVTGEYAGAGFLLIKRNALLRMIEAYPETRFSHIHSYTNAPAGVSHALFESEIDRESGLYLSEDFAFCRKFRAIGGKIWLDTEGRLTHVGSHLFEGAPLSRFAHVCPEQAPLESQFGGSRRHGLSVV